jgi:two-component system OmpR family response regulator
MRTLRRRPRGFLCDTGGPAMTLLLVEDDDELARWLSDRLAEQGYTVDHAGDGEAGLAAARDHEYEVIILDRMLPRLSGLDLVKALRREQRQTPVIYLTTMGGIDDRVQGLEAGGDDYLVKPFAFVELLARIRVIERRSAGTTTRLAVGSLELDLITRAITRAGRPIELLPQEFRLLEYLMRNADRAVTRKMLLEKVWNIHFDPHTSVVESHISRLRSRLNEGFELDAIQTVRGIGYRLLAAT